MGQKVHPIGFRLAVSKDWQSRWYAPQGDYADQLHADLKVRRYLESRLQKGAVSRVIIERAWNSVRVTLHTSRPGLIIGKRGQEIEVMTADISRMCKGSQVKIDIHEIRQPELDSAWVAAQVATQLERRVSFRRAMKRAIQTAMDFGADGIRIRAAGRLGGADIARAEAYREGKVPLQTLRVPIDYGFAEAETTWGIIGVKVWITKKDEVPGEGPKRPRREGAPRGQGGGPRPPRRDQAGA
ncbi:MAG: small subunit ribosomal protein S3 [Verrucomicrobia bacterium]|jgi:small subunit ribosomal protein S3|nr:MAG: small subunit ribosomal protein S3 [Verrucomicrobiota bacterium]